MFLMNLGLQVTLIVVGAMLGLWIALLIVNLIFVGSFSTIFKRHKKALPVILITKHDNLKNVINILNQSGVDLDNRYIALLNDINENDFVEPGSAQFEKSKNTLSYLKDELFFIADQHPELNGDSEFKEAKQNIIESDTLYRNTVMMYNADVLGYNYWIRFLPCRFIFKLFRVKKKQIIS